MRGGPTQALIAFSAHSPPFEAGELNCTPNNGPIRRGESPKPEEFSPKPMNSHEFGTRRPEFGAH